MAVSTTQPQYTTASLYIGDLHPEVTEAVLYEFYRTVGPVASIRVCRDSVTRHSLGYAYVNFQNASDAERALDTLNFTPVKGVPMRIMWSRRDPALRKSGAGNIFVKNLDKAMDTKALFDTFSLFGNILSCKVAVDEEGKSRGFGFVHYETEDSAKTAIDRVNNMQIGNKTVYVAPFQKRNDRHQDQSRFTNVYVKNFPIDWTESNITEVFTKFGEITSQALNKDAKGRPFAFVNFESMDAAMKAVQQLHNREVANNSLVEGDAGMPNEGELDIPNGATDEKKEKKIRLYVQRAQSKTERQHLLKSKFTASQMSNGLDNRGRQQGTNLYVKNLEDSIDDEKLREMFEEFGNITSSKVMRNDKGVSRGFGFVCFSTNDEAHKAVDVMHLKLLNQKPLYVAYAEKRELRIQRLRARYQHPPPPAGMIPPGGQMFAPNQVNPMYSALI
eukprot:Platyproteum_vivax@DN7279_c0_g1_i1.p1